MTVSRELGLGSLAQSARRPQPSRPAGVNLARPTAQSANAPAPRSVFRSYGQEEAPQPESAWPRPKSPIAWPRSQTDPEFACPRAESEPEFAWPHAETDPEFAWQRSESAPEFACPRV